MGVRRRGNLVEMKVIEKGIGIEKKKMKIVLRELKRIKEGMREEEGMGIGI